MTHSLSVTFDNDSSIEDRTVNFGALTLLDSNQYNLKVIDANDAEVTGIVAGSVSVMITPPEADRSQTTSSPVDLSSGDRTFQLFILSVRTAVFSVTGLAAGNRVVATCFRKKP